MRQTGGLTVLGMLPSSATAPEPDRNGTGRYAVRRAAGGPSPASTIGGPGPRLWGRRSECEVLDRLLDELRAGTSSVLVLRGEAGIGKTALLEYLLDRSSGCRVALAAGVESEMELAYAGLHQLCAPMLDGLERLPAPQRDALGTAFGLQAGGAPDRFLVGLAVLGLLSDVADERPQVCVVDDAQWLDKASAQVLAFVARRLVAESVAVVFAVRDSLDEHELTGIAELEVNGLVDGDARALLESVIAGPIDVRVRDRIVAETRGNPLALLELPRGLTPAEMAGGFGLPDAAALSGRIEETFRRRLTPLPAQTRRLLLVAAAEPTGDPLLLWRAASELGIDLEAAPPAVAVGLVDFDSQVRFRHPLVRSAVYRAASPEERRSVHRALAESTDVDVDPDRRAWHRAHAAPALDEDVAAELARSAGRAQARGGLAAAAAFLERAAALTPSPARRAQRALEAAQAELQAGAFGAALALLTAAEAGPLDALQRARVDMLRAQIAFASSRRNEAAPLLLAAARRLEPLDAALARETYLDAFSAAMFAGRLAGAPGLPEVAEAARRAPPASHQPRKADMLLDGLAVLFTDGYAAATQICRRALQAFCSEDSAVEDDLRWLWLASITAADLWDDETWYVLSNRHVRIAREAGALSELPLALNSRVFVHLFAGELAAADSLVEQARAVKEATGSNLAPYGAVGLAALQGRTSEVGKLIEASMSEVVPRGEGIGVTVTQWANALLYNGLGGFHDALVAARQAAEYPREPAVANWGLTELIEAAVRSGRPELAADALDRLSKLTRASGTDWALGVEARSRALLTEGDAAESLYREAIERLSRTRVRVELARAHLLYGEWLRRAGRRRDARAHLHTAHEMLAAMGADAFAERARRELLATGETVRTRSVETRDDLTPQETQIARLASDGRTNPEIGTQLFISPRTVEWHLRNVFTKLDIRSRRELAIALANSAAQPAPA
jgi:DNA-binding CsgD family transcriptional regulator